MYFDRFDICEAYYLFLSHYHNGQSSSEYLRLCNLQRYFKPSPMLTHERLSDNGKQIYATLEAKLPKCRWCKDTKKDDWGKGSGFGPCPACCKGEGSGT